MIPFMKRYKGYFIVAFVGIVLFQASLALLPFAEGQIINQLASNPSAFGQLAWVCLQAFVIYLIKTLTNMLSAYCLAKASQSTMADIRQAVNNQLHELPVAYFDREKTGELLSRITNDVDTLSSAFQDVFQRFISIGLTLIFVTIMMVSLQPMMALIVWCALPILGGLSFLIFRVNQTTYRSQQDAMATLNGTVSELYDGQADIVLYGQQESAFERFEKDNRQLAKLGFKAQLTASLLNPLSASVTYILMAILLLYGLNQWMLGLLTLGALQAFTRYVWQMLDPISQLAQLTGRIQSAIAANQRLHAFLHEERLTQGDLTIDQPIDSIRFEHVQFGYDKPLMKNLNLTIQKGQTVAIVGATGAGKTTLSQLLLRFYDVQAGAIKLNDINIKDLSFRGLREHIALVLQDTWLFDGTIEENVRFGNEAVSQAVLDQAYEITQLTNPQQACSSLSVGQRQLVSLARALVSPADILILDEATANIDTRLEKAIQSAMDQLMAKRTSLVIAHRLSTIIHADMILVMDQGAIVEQGRHEQLLAQGGIYAKLYQSQFVEED